MVSMVLTGLLLFETVKASGYTISNMRYDTVGIINLPEVRKHGQLEVHFVASSGFKPRTHELWAKSLRGVRGGLHGLLLSPLFHSWPSSLGVVSR